jgi:hypothetical protein
VGLLVIALVRTWVALIVIISITGGAVIGSRSRALGFGVLLLGAVALAFTWQQLIASFAISELDDVLALTSHYSTGWHQGGSALSKVPEFHSWRDVVVFFPEGAFTALFRPLPGEVSGAFALLAGFENLVLLVVVFTAVVRVRRWLRVDAALLAMLAFIAGWLITYAPISFQNLGTAVRFKMQVLPFVLLVGYLALVSFRREDPGALEAQNPA